MIAFEFRYKFRGYFALFFIMLEMDNLNTNLEGYFKLSSKDRDR
jgi:hypothetical protein